MKEFSFLQSRFIDDDFYPFGFDALHDALDAGRPEVIRTFLHDETIDAYHFWIASQDVAGYKVLTRGVGFNDGVNQVLRHIAVVCQ